jgi:hypothetical protein
MLNSAEGRQNGRINHARVKKNRLSRETASFMNSMGAVFPLNPKIPRLIQDENYNTRNDTDQNGFKHCPTPGDVESPHRPRKLFGYQNEFWSWADAPTRVAMNARHPWHRRS